MDLFICREIKEATIETKYSRAKEVDRITADNLKTNPGVSAKCILALYIRVWNYEVITEAWQKGIIIK